MVGSGIVKLIADPNVVRFFRTLEAPTKRLLGEAGFDVGELLFRHFLKHYRSTIDGGYQTSVTVDNGSRILYAGGIIGFPLKNEEVWDNLIYVAGRYIGIGPEPLKVDPPYIVLTTPDEVPRIIEAFRKLDCSVEEIARSQPVET